MNGTERLHSTLSSQIWMDATVLSLAQIKLHKSSIPIKMTIKGMAKHSKQMNVYKQINKHAIHLGHMATELICNEDDWDRILEHFPFLTGQVPKHFQSRTQKDPKKKKNYL